VIVALVGQKGGSGKSTLAILLAAELMARGRRVLLVDADPQKTAVTWGDVAIEGGHKTPTIVALTGTLHQPQQLPQLAASYDHTFIDTPPRAGEIQRSALAVADLAVLPCGPTPAEAWAIAASVDTVRQAQEFRPELKARIVVNKRRSGTAAARGVRQALEATGIEVLAAELGLRQAFADALGAGLGVGAYAPRDLAAAELAALADELFSTAKRTPKRNRHAEAR